MGRISIVREYHRPETGILDQIIRGQATVQVPVSAGAVTGSENANRAIIQTFRRMAKESPEKMAKVIARIKGYRLRHLDRLTNQISMEVMYAQDSPWHALRGGLDSLRYVRYCETQEEIVDAITSGILETQPEITILMASDEDHLESTPDYLEEAYRTHRPGRINDGAYLKSHCGFKGEVRRALLFGIKMIHYTMVYQTTAAQEEELMAAVDAQIRQMGLDRPGVSVSEKITAVYRYIAKNTEYDRDLKRFTAYDAMIGHRAVCMGYALLFLLFMRKLHVPVEYMTGTALPSGERHGWNLVKLGVRWYHVDTTWEKYQAGKRIQMTARNYFLKCDEDFKDHIPDDIYLTDAFKRTHPMALHSIR